jgi:hypothetical protein
MSKKAVVPMEQQSLVQERYATYDTLQVEHATLTAEVRRLKDEVKKWQKYSRKRRLERDQALRVKRDDPTHPLAQAYYEARREAEQLRTMLRDKLWEQIGWPGTRPQAPGQAWTADALKHLLTVAHPDKWSAGQSALDLAHEITVVLTRLLAATKS